MDTEPGQHPPHVGGMAHEVRHVLAGQGEDFPHFSGHTGEEGRTVRGDVRQRVRQGSHVSTAQGRLHVLLGILQGDVVGGPVEQDVETAPSGFRHLHAQHWHTRNAHVHGYGVPLMAGQDFSVRRGHQRQQKAQLAQGQLHQVQTLRVSLAGIVQGGPQGGNGHKLNSGHSRASAGFPP